MTEMVIDQAFALDEPLYKDKYGDIRVRGTRVLVDLVVAEFHAGKTPEQIVASYPTLALADVYAAIAYYLNHRAPIDDYIRQRDEAGAALRREMEALNPQQGLRERLLSRLSEEQREYFVSRFGRTAKGIDPIEATNTIRDDIAHFNLPLWMDDSGTVWIKPSNLWLDVIVYAYHDGQDPEDVVQDYLNLSLANVHTLFGYYLGHQPTVDAYMLAREKAIPTLRDVVDHRFPPAGRLARQAARQAQ
jgi:uncharacterized protein (DUF433 family)